MNAKNIFFLLLIISLIGLVASCQRRLGSDLQREVEGLQQQLAQDVRSVALDTLTAQQLIAKSQQYASAYPQAPPAPTYLFRAADVARGIGNYQRAINLWQQIRETYPQYEKLPETLFFQGFTYENDLQQPELARTYYQLFIEKYPHHSLLPTVEASLKNLTQTPAELIRAFEQQNNWAEGRICFTEAFSAIRSI